MKARITLEEIERRLRDVLLPEVDAVVAIEPGGRVPGELISSIVERPLGLLRLAYRDDSNAVQHEEPRILDRTAIPCPAGGRILLVDDVSASGATLRRAALELSGYAITTLVHKGAADIVIFPELDACVTWPWAPSVLVANGPSESRG